MKKNLNILVGVNNLVIEHKVYQREALKHKLNIRQPKWTPKQQELINLVLHSDTKVLFLKGGAGSAKTFCSIYCALELLNRGRIKEIIMVRSLAESGQNPVGILPGDLHEKTAHINAPFEDKLLEFLTKADIAALHKDERLHFLPTNHLRGRSFNASFIILDESQNCSLHEIQTLVSRQGKYSKTIVTGDHTQSDFLANGKRVDSGFYKFFQYYEDLQSAKNLGIHTFKFGLEDIMRDPVVAFFVDNYQKLITRPQTDDWIPSYGQSIIRQLDTP